MGTKELVFAIQGSFKNDLFVITRFKLRDPSLKGITVNMELTSPNAHILQVKESEAEEKMRRKEGEGKFGKPKDWSQIWMHFPWLRGSHVGDDDQCAPSVHHICSIGNW